MNTSASTITSTNTAGLEFYASHPEAHRTMRMDSGGLCQLCARKTARRVEMHTPLWQAGPLMYGECCLPQAEEALLRAHLGPKAPAAAPPASRPGAVHRLWLTVAAAGVAALAAGLERLLQLRPPHL